MRIIIVPILVLAFVAWLFYHLLYKKDIKKQMPNVYAGALFIAVWVAVYLFV